MGKGGGMPKSRKFIAVIALSFSLFLALSLLYNLHLIDVHAREKALAEARGIFELNLAYRRWNAGHGGVYVPVTRDYRPNPYLTVHPRRDITAVDGARYTVVNPAIMTRHVHDILSRSSELPVLSKVTSLKSLNPDNAPDTWEEQALRSFEKGSTEANEVVQVKGQPYLRLLKPYYTEQGCLVCHAGQGYQLGDVRGGLSVGVPMRPHLATATLERNESALSHFLMWITGMSGILLLGFQIRRHEERITESEWKFRTLAESSSDWEYWMTDDGAITFMSPSSAQVTGYAPEEFTNDPSLLTRLIHPEDRERWSGHLRDFEKACSQELVYRIITKDGAVRWLSHSCDPISRNGISMGRRVSNRDVTERQTVEDALHAEKAFTDAAVNTMMGVFYVLDSQRRYRRWNKALEEVWAAANGDLSGKDPLALIHPDDRDEVARKLAEVFEQGYAETEARTKGKCDEEVRHYFLMGKRMLLGGEPYLVGSGMDITERVRSEDALRKWAQIFEHAEWGIVVGSADGRTLELMNPAFARMHGYEVAELQGRPIMEVFAPAARDDLPGQIRTAHELGHHAFESLHLKKDGTVFPALVDVTAVKDEAGRVLYRVVNVQDLTERKKLEAQLRQSQKMEALGQLTGGIAHDFNNILSAVVGFASILRRKVQDLELAGFVDEVLAAGKRGGNLTKSLLAFSRKQTMDLQRVNVNEVIEGFQKMLTRIISEDIVLRTDLAAGSLVVEADAGQLEQVFLNLATNARDAMPQGGTFTIATSSVEIDERNRHAVGFGRLGRYVLITVSDTGAGMGREVVEHIFEPFYTTKGTGKGTGLGLSIVYGIISKHNGSISVYSEPGHGTVFKIYLPLLPVRGVDRKESAAAVLPGGSETVLLVEDEEPVRRSTRLMLQELGYTVIEACDGEEAVRVFREERDRVHLVLCDLIMPKMNGKEACREMRAIRPDIRVVYMSGYTRDIIQQKGIDERDLLLISKPIDPAGLAGKVREALSG